MFARFIIVSQKSNTFCILFKQFIIKRGFEISDDVNVGDVIYNAHFPLIAPDVVFGPEDEHFRPYNTAGEGDSKSLKNSLSDWNGKDPTRLLALILELRLGVYLFSVEFHCFCYCGVT